jgi:8-oxo-dGTP diphosphatase
VSQGGPDAEGCGSVTEALHVVGAAIVEGDRCLVAQRGPSMPLPGAWELPGGKVEPGEDPREALRREIAEELGIRVEVGEFLGQGCAEAEGRRVVLDVYLARWRSGRIELAEHQAWRWVDAEEIPGLSWAAADLPVLPALATHLRSGHARR